jgi:UDP-N-acetylmuramyl pentapeptide synthase
LEITEILVNELQKGDTILFKASRGMKLEEIFESIYKQWDVE